MGIGGTTILANIAGIEMIEIAQSEKFCRVMAEHGVFNGIGHMQFYLNYVFAGVQLADCRMLDDVAKRQGLPLKWL
ncbi:MAG: hypothetical protein IT427_20300 [Pirellulales bacterium]|nr:hypothetical protein [Pirellulales bacterium]